MAISTSARKATWYSRNNTYCAADIVARTVVGIARMGIPRWTEKKRRLRRAIPQSLLEQKWNLAFQQHLYKADLAFVLTADKVQASGKSGERELNLFASHIVLPRHFTSRGIQ